MRSLEILLCFNIWTALSTYTIYYKADEKDPQLAYAVDKNLNFIASPTAEHVADIYTRLSGQPALLREGMIICIAILSIIGFSLCAENVHLPTTDIFSKHHHAPLLLEVYGGSNICAKY